MVKINTHKQRQMIQYVKMLTIYNTNKSKQAKCRNSSLKIKKNTKMNKMGKDSI